MSLQTDIMAALKDAMKRKDTVALEALRAIKSEILLANTSGKGELEASDEMKILQKLVKQRKESAELFNGQGRKDLADAELAQAAVIEKFLPAQMSEDEVKSVIKVIIEKVGATTAKDMGKVMGVASKELAGKADGKVISEIVKSLLG